MYNIFVSNFVIEKRICMIYADNAATTPLGGKVLEAMTPYLTEHYGNPSSIYKLGRTAKTAVNEARKSVAAILGANESEIYFTASGSEANNWAIKGAAYANTGKGKHLITTQVEHHAVLHCFEHLEKNGFTVTYLPVDKYGMVSVADLEKSMTPETTLVSIMTGNNETGTIMPVKELAAAAKKGGALFHTDAVQAAGHIPVNVNDLGVDMLSLSAHKFEGPKGVGALYIRKRTKLQQFIHGGGQESNKRAGTENVAGIVGLAKALELSVANLDANMKKIASIRDSYTDQILKRIPYSHLNGHETERLPGIANISFDYIEGESILLSLDMEGIAASSGSACTSGSLDPSHVLLAMGLDHATAHGSVRISFSHRNTQEEADRIVSILETIVRRLRDMSPLYESVKNQ